MEDAQNASEIIKGEESLSGPNWKEKRTLGDDLAEGYRLACQLRIRSDIELTQEEVAAEKNLENREISSH
ncbi:hypothetical protein QS257_21480 [Terrilactibacillus sp. S3-3]|nr:hypothetical protein QS257_21480 [Terrilactibacillus sp. S3-3]